jgi:hypothetical protein
MGWWKSGNDLLGDGPADLFMDGLREFASEHGKPTWQEFLNAFDAALGTSRRLHVVFDGGGELRSNPALADALLRDRLADIIGEVTGHYRERRERDATASEIVGTARFSPSARPEKYLRSEGEMPRLQNLTFESAPAERKTKN